VSKKLIDAMADLNEEEVLKEVKALKEKKVPSLEIISYLQEGTYIVGKRFENKEYFLSELIMSGELFTEASKLLGDTGMGGGANSKYGTFLLGTIYEDIHDIGKNIVNTVLSSNGFNVVDIGVDVPTSKFIESIKKHNPKAVGISCLLTTAFDNIKECIQSIEKAGLRKDLKILIGGGPVDEATGKYVGADKVCKNAQVAVDYCKTFMGVK
jgi:dimethylamine corrinoid protein